MSKFYKVSAKCGHVGGRKYYTIKDLYVQAENGREAANRIRLLGRVKHDDKEAIKRCVEISEEEFREGVAEAQKDPYFHCHSKQESALHILTNENVYCEENVYEPWKNKYEEKRREEQTRHNRKRQARFGYVNSYRLETQGYYDYSNYDDSKDVA